MRLFDTTQVRVEAWLSSAPGTRTVVAEGPATVGDVTGKQSSSYRGAAIAGWYQDATAKMVTETLNPGVNDIVVDLTTGDRYRVQWDKRQVGLGLDHFQAGLEDYNVTGTYDILRGTTLDEFGDQVPDLVEVYSGLEGEVREIARSVTQSTGDAPTTVRSLSGRFGPFLDVRKGDQVRNTLTGDLYTVLSANLVTSSLQSDTDLELVRNL